MAGYNTLSGRDLERIRVLADGVFAVAMTLLVLDLRLPAGEVADSGALRDQLGELGPEIAAYALSFTMLGTFWLAVHAVLDQARGSDRTLAWSVLTFLFFVTTLPFSASVLADHAHLRLAVALYWANLAMLGAGLAWQLWHVSRAGLAEEGEALVLVRRRLVLAQALYAAAALLALLSPVAAIAGLALVQLFFMVSPRLPWRT
ncbi:TMEM175 family protein [Nocardioides panacisoli]|uniref:TMEM175 family protein n=1 Tax=Nocardioides panacisoli TaxID=627624 RepID=A0ABP7J3F9_9ACTN